MSRLVILGAGGYGNTVKDIAEQLGYEVIQLDDADTVHPLASFSEYINSCTEFIPAFGNNEFRISWMDKLQDAGALLATLSHPTAYVSPKAKIEKGVVILPHAIVNTDVVIKRGCILNLGCMVDHGCVIEEGVHLCLGCIVKGENRVKAFTKIEAGEIIEARRWPVKKA